MTNKKSSTHRKPSKSKASLLRRSQRFSLAQLLVFVLVFGSIGGYAIYKSLAARPAAGIGWSRYFENTLGTLDGQGSPAAPVHNYTGCVWNDQDQIENLGWGDIASSTSNTICLVADFDAIQSSYPHIIVFKVYAPGDTLDVSLSNDVGNVWNSPPSTASGNQRLWQMCVVDPVADNANVGVSDLSYWPEIPGSNGGRGKIVNYTLHLTSTKGTTHKVFAYFEIGPNGSAIRPNIQYPTYTPCPQHSN
jgi:hypothetical protein